jgi:hypothetical protein
MYMHSSASEPRLTPRGQGRHTHFPNKRPGTPAAEFLEAATEFGSPHSLRKRVVRSPGKTGAVWDESIQMVDPSDVEYGETDLADDGDTNSVSGFDGVENARACCGGAHSLTELGQSARKRHLQHYQHTRAGPFSEADSVQPAKEASPSLRAGKSLSARKAPAMFDDLPTSPTQRTLAGTVPSLRAAR